MFGYIFYILLAGRLFTVPEKKYVTLTEVGRSNEKAQRCWKSFKLKFSELTSAIYA